MYPLSLFIAVCTNRSLHPLWTLRLIHLYNEASKLFRYVKFNFFLAPLLPTARQIMVESFLQSGFSHLLFLDDDIIPPNHGLYNLFLDGVPIVAGHYMCRRPPFHSLLELFRDESDTVNPPNPRLVPAKFVPLGFTLIERQVFLDIKPPHFIMTPTMGEDNYFSMRARKAGYKLYIDKEVECLHISEAFFGTQEFTIAPESWGTPPVINPKDIQRKRNGGREKG